jgi:dGTPase
MDETLTIRGRTEAREREILAPWASCSADTRGRASRVSRDDLRTEYQRDRDRIVHSKAFRRLAYKTQVFLAPEGDHYRTRLTHTLEVSQIARTIARALRLNEDLAEAISLGHDLGHTPFGHVGEDALTAAFAEVADSYPGTPGAFKHHEQSVRVVETLEYEGKGLNLTWEVRDGIARHSLSSELPATAEARVVRLADKIAYVSHDLDDALRAGVIAGDDVPPGVGAVLGPDHAARLNTMVTDLVAHSDDGDISMSPEVEAAMLELRGFLHDNVYVDSAAKRENPKAVSMIRQLFDHFLAEPDEMPASPRDRTAPLPVQVADYVSGMTDRFAITTFVDLYVPRSWAHDSAQDPAASWTLDAED